MSRLVRIAPDARRAGVKAASNLVPLLRRNARATEENRWIVAENLRAIESAGLLSLGVPARFGGQPVDQRTLHEVIVELARGCGSTGWVTSIFLADIGLVCAFPEQAQEEVFCESA